jgi:hypothetical protein
VRADVVVLQKRAGCWRRGDLDFIKVGTRVYSFGAL